MNRKNHFQRFMSDENGSELMQWAIIIIIVVGLAVVAYAIADKLKGKLDEASSVLDDIGNNSSV